MELQILVEAGEHGVHELEVFANPELALAEYNRRRVEDYDGADNPFGLTLIYMNNGAIVGETTRQWCDCCPPDEVWVRVPLQLQPQADACNCNP